MVRVVCCSYFLSVFPPFFFAYEKLSSTSAQGNVAATVKANLTLIKLHLARNSIGSNGAQSLTEALKTNSTLDLRKNSIGDDGAWTPSEGVRDSL